MQRAMAKQAGVKREKRAKIIAAEGLSVGKLAEAADVVANSPIALQLRNLQVLARSPSKAFHDHLPSAVLREHTHGPRVPRAGGAEITSPGRNSRPRRRSARRTGSCPAGRRPFLGHHGRAAARHGPRHTYAGYAHFAATRGAGVGWVRLPNMIASASLNVFDGRMTR